MLLLKDKVYWTGIKDWELQTFHGQEYKTHKGSSYNSYLVKDTKTVLVDTVWDPFKEEFVENLEKDIGLENIDAIVVNHSEVDHSGSLEYLMSKLPADTPVYCTKHGAEILQLSYHKKWNFQIVKTGDTLKTGDYELMFIEASMLHWPDNMMTYVKGANILLSNDAFGQHYAAYSLFNDEVDECTLYEEAVKYYANILTPYSAQAKKKIDEIRGMDLNIEMIAPSHGVIWRNNPMQIVDKYYEWAQSYQENLVLVLYDTMWNGTRNMAHAIAGGLREAGTPYKIINTALTDHTSLYTDIFKAKGIIVGSPTVNNTVLSSIASLLVEIKGLRFKNKAGAAFGTYGWSGESTKFIQQGLQDAGFKIVQDPIKARYQPSGEDIIQCREFGKRFAESIK